MSDVGTSRSPSDASTETAKKAASQSSSPPPVRRDSRVSTLPYAGAGSLSPAGQRMMHMRSPGGNPAPPQPSINAAATPSYFMPSQATMSSAASMRSAAMSNYNPAYSMHGRNPSMPYAGSVMSSRGFAEIPTATSDNDYLGFCKGAWKVQNGDRKGAMEKCKEAQSWSRNASKSTTLAAHLKCQQPKCSFRSNYISPDASFIWDKVSIYPDKGVKLRWRFLAKSHVPQKVVLKNQFAFKCIICVYMGQGARAGVYVGTDYYLDHINSEHRGQHFHDVMLYKIGCINDRVAEDDEDFDINIWPLSVHHEPPPSEHYLSDTLLGDPTIRPSQAPGAAGMNSNQPWVVDATDYEEFHSQQQMNHATPQHMYPYMTPAISSPPPERSGAGMQHGQNGSYQNAAVSSASQWQPQHGHLAAPMNGQSERRLSTNTDESQSSALTTSLTNILQVFGDGSIIIDQLKANSAVVHLPFLDLLEQTMHESPQEITKEWQRGVQRSGPAYEAGDYLAIIALSQMTIQLHNNVVDKLRRAVYSGERTDLRFLADAADTCRQQTIATLHDFKQRLLQAPPPQHMMHPSVPPTAAAAMQQAQQAQREASQPRQHLSHMRPDIWKDPYMPNAANTTNRKASNASSMSDRSRHQSETSDGSDTRRRISLLGTIKEKASRRTSTSKSTQQEGQAQSTHTPQHSQSNSIDEISRSMQQDLRIHPALRNRSQGPKHGTLSEVAELDANMTQEAT